MEELEEILEYWQAIGEDPSDAFLIENFVPDEDEIVEHFPKKINNGLKKRDER